MLIFKKLDKKYESFEAILVLFLVIAFSVIFFMYIEQLKIYKVFFIVQSVFTLISIIGFFIYKYVDNKKIFISLLRKKIVYPIYFLFILSIFNLFFIKNQIDSEFKEKKDKEVLLQNQKEFIQKQEVQQKENEINRIKDIDKKLLLARNFYSSKNYYQSIYNYNQVKGLRGVLEKSDNEKILFIENKLKKERELEITRTKGMGLKKGDGNWYQGGNLHSVDLVTWHNSEYNNRVATSSDFISTMYLKKRLKINIDFLNNDEFLQKSKELELCITNSTKDYAKIMQKDTPKSMAVVCMTLMEWIDLKEF